MSAFKAMVDRLRTVQSAPDVPTALAEAIELYVDARLEEERTNGAVDMTPEQDREAALKRLAGAVDGRGLKVSLKPTREELYRLSQFLAPNVYNIDLDVHDQSLTNVLKRKRLSEMALVRNIMLVADAYWHELWDEYWRELWSREKLP